MCEFQGDFVRAGSRDTNQTVTRDYGTRSDACAELSRHAAAPYQSIVFRYCTDWGKAR